jgi:hypothetical protein
MLCKAVALAVLTLPILAQSDKPQSAQEITRNSEKERDANVLSGLQKLKIGAVGLNEKLKVTEAEGRKLLFDALARYNVPVQLPSTTRNALPDTSILTLSSSVTTTQWPIGLVSNHINIRLELWEDIRMTRKPNKPLYASVWNREEALELGSVIERDQIIEVIKALSEQFCLSYLSVNR